MKSTHGVLLVLLAFLIPSVIVYIFSCEISVLRSMPKHTFVSAKLSANTAIFFQTVSWTVFLCNVCLGCPKTEAHFCQNAQMSFLVAFFPPVPFLYPFLYCLVPWHPGLESSVCLDLKLWNQQTADRTSSACSMQLERGPWACLSDGDSALEIP